MLRWLVVLAVLAGCSSKEGDRPKPTPAPETSSATTAPVDAAAALPPIPAGASGVIEGRVTFDGPAPEPIGIDASSDPFCAKAGVRDERIVIGGDRGVRDVVVRLPPKAFRSPAPDQPVVITQEACRYAPRVSVAVEGQAIEVRNADDTVHNVHGYDVGVGGDRALYNEAQIAGAKPIVKPTAGRELVKLTCDIHPWMRGYVVVSSHGLAAVTGADGRYRIEGVPPGSYELEVWHPELGLRKIPVTMAPDSAGPVVANASYGP